MEESNNRLIICKICLFPYDNDERIPRVINCGHTLCDYCLINIKKQQKVECPFCKKYYDKIKEFPVNFEILNFINNRRIDHYCSKHKNENLNFYCSIDRIMICQLCLLNNHIGHEIVKPNDSEIGESIKFANYFKDFYSKFMNIKYNNQKLLKENFIVLDRKFEKMSNSLKEIRDMIKFQFYSQQKETNNRINLLELLDKQIKQEYQNIKNGKESKFSKNILESYIEHENFFNVLKNKNLCLNQNEHFLLVKSCIESLKDVKDRIMETTDTQEIKRPEYLDIDNIVEFLLDGRLLSIRYNTDKSSIEHKNLIDKSCVKTECSCEFISCLMKSIDRLDFVPSNSLHVYSDMPMIIGWNTTISAPHMHMLTLLNLSKYVDKFRDKKLSAIDIGSGSGFMTLCLSKLLGPFSLCIGLDHIKEIVDLSKNNISKRHKHFIDMGRIKFVSKDGRDGYKENAPYHIIHVGAAVEEIPQHYIDQLELGGILWIPVGPKNDYKKIMILQKENDGRITKQELMSVSYAEMVSVKEQLKITNELDIDEVDYF